MENDEKEISRQDVMQEISNLRDSVDKWRKPLEEKIEKHHLALFGNGKPGLDEEVRNINAKLETLMKLAWIVTTAAVSVSVAGVIGAFVWIVKNMP